MSSVHRTVLPLALLAASCGHRADVPPASIPPQPAVAVATTASSLSDAVARMAAVDRAYGASWSPDGSRLAFVSSALGSPQAFTVAADGTDLRPLTAFEEQVRGVAWSPKGETIAVAAAPGGGMNTQLYLVPAEGGEAMRITAGGDDNNWLGDWSADGAWLTFASNVAGTGSVDGYMYDVATAEARMVADNGGICGVEALSPDATRAVVWQMKSRGNTDLYGVELSSGVQHRLTPHEGAATSGGAQFLDDHSVLFTSNIDRERIALVRMTLDDAGRGGPMEVVASRDDADVDGFDIDAAGTTAAVLWNVAGRTELSFLDVATGALTDGPSLPMEIARSVAFGPGATMVLTLSGAAAPTDVWTLDRDSGAFVQITRSAHDGVDLSRLVRPTLVDYVAHDGLALSGWLYRPTDADGPGPIVLAFHGGPEGQARPGFRADVQALVARGISVFAPNVRGSAGFGRTFVNLDNGALRFDAVRDIASTADHLVAEGIADPERMGIMGGSYGGYMVMAGLADYPDRFAAGANLFGVVNFETFFANTEGWMAAISTIEYGDPVTDAALLRELSPIHRLDQVVAPTLVLHGANDTNVPVVEAEQVVDGLKARGVPVSYVLFPDEGHGWQKTENRVTSTVEIVTWFETHLGEGP